ncbi:hypothetical protein [Sneathiella aquimaris]|uniref:hypothetical protein n=1 Tax=Sneathiella aquimaris TaxID=2599305 RepID=UPI00146B19B3|nr:hypothetical protein [Sneathiella aquimaris]
MSKNTSIQAVADRYFHLWQQQVSMLAQSPDSGFDELMVKGRKLAEALGQEYPFQDVHKPPSEET